VAQAPAIHADRYLEPPLETLAAKDVEAFVPVAARLAGT